jgi:hypothetical protein
VCVGSNSICRVHGWQLTRQVSGLELENELRGSISSCRVTAMTPFGPACEPHELQHLKHVARVGGVTFAGLGM